MADPRVVHMYMDGWAKHKILDTDKKTVLYRSHRHVHMFNANANKPEVEVFRPDPKEPGKDILVGAVSRRRSNKADKTMDVKIGDQDVELHLESSNRSMAKVTRVYQSPRPKVGQVRWEAMGDMMETAQMTEDDVSGDGHIVLAEMQRLIAWKKFARMQIYRDGPQELLDEIAVTTAAMWLSMESADGENVSSVYGTTTTRTGKTAKAG